MPKKSNDKVKTAKETVKKKAQGRTPREKKPRDYSLPRASRTKKITDAMIIKAIKTSNHIMSNVAEALMVDWHVARDLVNRNDKTKEAWEAADELILDILEERAQAIAQVDPITLRYMLDRKGRKRGYGEKVDMDLTSKGDKLPDNQPAMITVIRLPDSLRPKPEAAPTVIPPPVVLPKQNDKQTPTKK